MSTAIKISLNIMFLVLGVLLTAQWLGLLTDSTKEKLETRITLSESIAVQCSILANRKTSRSRIHRTDDRDQYREIEAVLKSFVDRNDEVLSAGMRMDSGLKVSVGNHLMLWNTSTDHEDVREHISVPIMKNDEKWATVELCFTPLEGGFRVFGFAFTPILLTIICITSAAGVGSIFYFSRMFNASDSGAVPSRVRSALDTLIDGLIVLDHEDKIVFANRAFEESTGFVEADIVGRPVAELGWKQDWNETIEKNLDDEEKQKIVLKTAIGEIDFTLGVSDVLNDKGKLQGKVVCFNDVTVLEKRREELMYTMRSLQSSRDMIKEQNEKLKILATRDPLTNCWNRRAFFEEFYNLWRVSTEKSKPLSAVMLDIDHFKAVNDNHGHAVGDEVLRKVSATILELARDKDVVCRYGGEEFCILLPETSLADSKKLAENYRVKIEALVFEQLKVTVSQGTSSTVLKAKEPEELLEQADQALYVAKRTGRNQVVAFNEVPADFDLKETEDTASARKPEGTREEEEQRIPFQVVSSMISVLNHRDPSTAAHCIRVADLSFALGQGLMSASELYALEVGALLHDIGKIAVPDSILLKPEKLTAEELQTLRDHSRIGCELIEAAFHSSSVVETVRYAGCPYSGNKKYPAMVKGEQIPLSSRIVTITDAYDSMVTESVYRTGMSQQEAIDELRRCSGTQFDPTLVERFIEYLATRPEIDSTEVRKQQFSKDFALQLASISEQITKSFDEQDFDLLRANAQKLEAAANQYQNPKLKIIAAKLVAHASQSTENGLEVESIMTDVVDLLELCQSAQRESLLLPQRPTIEN